MKISFITNIEKIYRNNVVQITGQVNEKCHSMG
jgi:hypothetical protein